MMSFEYILELPNLVGLILGLTIIIFLLRPPSSIPIVIFSKHPSRVILKGTGESLTIEEAVRTMCKSLFSEYTSPWWLFNGHLQTIYCISGDFSRVDEIQYRRQLLRLTDGGTLGLDFAPFHDSDLKDDTPIVVVQHGLTGGSYEPYVRAILRPVCSSVKDGGLGYRAVVVNFRGCAGVPVTSPRLFSAGGTDDLRQSLSYLAKVYPAAPLLGLGFSLGANILTRYLAEEGQHARLNSACILACPWDLLLNDKTLQSGWISRTLYARGMGVNLQALVKRHYKVILRESDSELSKAAQAVMHVSRPTITEYHDIFGRFDGPAPSFPFASAVEYYKGMSSHCVVDDIKVPLLAINASDDPIVQHVPLRGDNSLAVMTLTPGGGHLGFFQSRSERWTTRPIMEWLQLVEMLEGVYRAPRELVSDCEGWIRERGMQNLGCRPVEGSSIIDGSIGEVGTLQGL